MSTDVLVALIGGVVGLSGAVLALFGKYLPQRVPKEDKLAKVQADLDELRADSSHDMRLLGDYVFTLRQHIADEKPPPPPPYPEGLRL